MPVGAIAAPQHNNAVQQGNGITASESQPENNECNPNYSPCVPNSENVTCKSLGMKNIIVIGYDVYGLDKDKDGIVCEQ